MNQKILNEGPSLDVRSLESELTTIWSEVLEMSIGDIDPDTSFREFGGDSISATLCVNRVFRMFKVDLAANALLTEEFTIRKLAALIVSAS